MKRAKGILQVLVTAVILAAALGTASVILTPKNNTEEAGHDAGAAYGFEAEPEGVIDVFMIGDSEARTSISPMELYHEQGITSYCCGINDGNLCTVWQMLRRILKTRSPRLIILECNVLYKETNWKDALWSELSYAVPAFQWHNRWKSLGLKDFTSLPRYTHVEDRKGYHYARATKAAPDDLCAHYMEADDSLEEIPSLNRCVLGWIAKLCRTHGCDLLLFSAPSVLNWTMARHNACERLASQLDEKAARQQLRVEYADLNLMTDAIPIDWDVDTRDGGDHLNNTGMKKVCRWAGPWLKEHYRLEDHRKDAACQATWTDLYDEYEKYVS